MQLPIYFISDIHLMLDESSDESAKRESLYRFLNFVRTTRGTLFFVGDLFDFYFEYPDVIPKSYFDFYNKAFQLKKAGVDLRFIAGNHDYWVLDFMKKKLMNHTYFDDTTFSLRGKNFYITHGDGVLSWDYGYRILKKIIRSPFFIWCFRLLHPTLAYKIARKVSRTENHPELPEEVREKVRNELKKYALTHFQKGFDYMVCGHYHLNEIIDVEKGKLAVLGDWQDDPSYAVFDGKELTLHQWENDA